MQDYYIFYESIPHSPAGFYYPADANGVLLLSLLSQAKLDELASILRGDEPCKAPVHGQWSQVNWTPTQEEGN